MQPFSRAQPLSQVQPFPGARIVSWSRLLAPAEAPGARAAAAASASAHSAAEARFLPQIAALEAELAAAHAAYRVELAACRSLGRAALADMEAALADELAGLAILLARALIEAEPRLDAATLAGLVGDALAAAPAGSLGTLRVNPAALEAASALLPSGWRAEPDPALPPGAVTVECGAMLARADMESRIAQAVALLETGE